MRIKIDGGWRHMCGKPPFLHQLPLLWPGQVTGHPPNTQSCNLYLLEGLEQAKQRQKAELRLPETRKVRRDSVHLVQSPC